MITSGEAVERFKEAVRRDNVAEARHLILDKEIHPSVIRFELGNARSNKMKNLLHHHTKTKAI